MVDKQMAFEERKVVAFNAAKKQGIVDVVQGVSDSVSLETLEAATALTEKHAPALYQKLEERWNAHK